MDTLTKNAIACCICLLLVNAASSAETLYNGIVLPEHWPPKIEKEAIQRGDVMPVPYLENPPGVIPIDVGRQLFVDDFLIETTNLKRTFHIAQYYANNPVVGPDRRWEKPGKQPTAMAFSDGVSLFLGLFSIWHQGSHKGRPKINDVLLGFSRDGFHWHRPFRQAVLPVAEDSDAWNWSNVQSVGGCCLVLGDKLYLYASGRKSQANSTGLAFMRRDGFASMDAEQKDGVLMTRPVVFKGKYLFVNADADEGELRVEVLGNDSKPIEPLSCENCMPIGVDKTLQRVTWQGAADLSAVAEKPVKFRFHLTNGRLYSFWVSPDESAASYGYVAAGGPGFTSSKDTVGVAAYQAAEDVVAGGTK